MHSFVYFVYQSVSQSAKTETSGGANLLSSTGAYDDIKQRCKLTAEVQNGNFKQRCRMKLQAEVQNETSNSRGAD